jgi:hypothetical protein
MKFHYKVSVIALCISFMSCEDWSHGKFEITNSTSSVIESISIQPDRKSARFISLKPNETKQYVTDMSGPAGVDGAYSICYKLNATSHIKQFGYYSNGASLEKLIKITIKNDTLLTQFIH